MKDEVFGREELTRPIDSKRLNNLFSTRRKETEKMKDEEMAREAVMNYAKEVIQKQIPYFDFAEQMFLAGLKAGRPQWHDINDKEPSKEQLGKQLLIRMESVIGDTDYDYLVYKYKGESITEIASPIAWCEIPTFDKEVDK